MSKKRQRETFASFAAVGQALEKKRVQQKPSVVPVWKKPDFKKVQGFVMLIGAVAVLTAVLFGLHTYRQVPLHPAEIIQQDFKALDAANAAVPLPVSKPSRKVSKI